ncbi:MAG: hypothetical protein TREMPRED_004179 [Tremellales sp. Tagirdzhanova-0007]|nr:MAG: hypothetical protein TREMPRED_004179 [Tremellales sp. Tagirdzhanova-0007]
MSEEALLAEKRKRVFAARDREERREAERRKNEWEEVESSALGGLKRMPARMKRSQIGESTVGGSETTAPTAISSFAPIPEASDDGTKSSTAESNTESGMMQTEESSRSIRTSEGSDGIDERQ